MRHPTDNRVHFSELRAMNDSPAHYRHACLTARERTRPMTVGSVADCLVFGSRGYAVYPGKVRNGRDWESFQRANDGKVLCIQSELDDALGASASVQFDPVAQGLLDGCEFQRVAQWEQHGLPCAAGIIGERGGFDAIHMGKRYIVDLKITSSAKPDELMRHAFRMFWHCQGAWYVDGARAMDVGVDEFYLLCVEATAPHCVTVLELPERVLDMGRKQVRLWTEKLRSCEESDTWPGYVQSIQTLEPPEWMVDVENAE